MIILGFDTSNSYSSVAISKGSEVIYAKKDLDPNTQAERLIIMIEEALRKTNIDYSKINYIACCTGPGSFTGIRISTAAAKGIMLAAPHIKPINVNNFQTVNFRIRQQYSDFDYTIASVNAHRNQVYLQVFDKNEEISEPQLVDTNDVLAFIRQYKGNKALGGSGWEKIFNVSSNIDNDLIILPRFAYPDARFACRIAHQQIVRHKENNLIEPMYIREPDAKIPTK